MINVGAWTIGTTVTIDKPLRLQGGSLNFSGGGRLKADSNNVTIADIDFLGDGTDHVMALGDANYTGWEFVNCLFDGISLRLTARGRTLSTGGTEPTGTGVTDGSLILNCEFTAYDQNYTIEVGGCDDVQIKNSYIHDTGLDVNNGDGIKVLAGSTNILIDNNTFANCTRDGIDTFDGGTVANPVTMSNNTISNCGSLGIDSKQTADDANDPQGDIITGNTISDCPDGGIQSDKDNNEVHDNVVIDCGPFGIRIDGINTPLATDGNRASGNTHDIRIGVELAAVITGGEQTYIINNNTFTTEFGLT